MGSLARDLFTISITWGAEPERHAVVSQHVAKMKKYGYTNQRDVDILFYAGLRKGYEPRSTLHAPDCRRWTLEFFACFHRSNRDNPPISIKESKKRKFELGRPPAMTKVGSTRIHTVRARGGNLKYRALRLDAGNFAWPTESVTKKCRVLNVVYNASNNELVRTNTLVKGAIIEIDSTPFRQWYEQHYGVKIGKKKEEADGETDVKKSNHLTRKLRARDASHTLAREMDAQFIKGRLLAIVTSRPGQSGRCDGYTIEGNELKFYEGKLSHKKKK